MQSITDNLLTTFFFFLQILPEDAHVRVNGKLHISLTRVYDRQNVIVSQFNTREELIQVLFRNIISYLIILMFFTQQYLNTFILLKETSIKD